VRDTPWYHINPMRNRRVRQGPAASPLLLQHSDGREEVPRVGQVRKEGGGSCLAGDGVTNVQPQVRLMSPTASRPLSAAARVVTKCSRGVCHRVNA
jgi:hypothetical protein